MVKKYPKVPEIIAGVLIYNKKGEILLVKSPKWNNKWIAVGGHVEFGEKIEETVRREVKEETALDIDNIEFLQYQELIFPKEFNRKAHLFVMRYCARALKLMSN